MWLCHKGHRFLDKNIPHTLQRSNQYLKLCKSDEEEFDSPKRRPIKYNKRHSNCGMLYCRRRFIEIKMTEFIREINTLKHLNQKLREAKISHSQITKKRQNKRVRFYSVMENLERRKCKFQVKLKANKPMN